MILKETFQYQNFLTSLINEAERYLQKEDFLCKKKVEHYKSKVNPEAKDEVLEVESSVDVQFAPNDIINLIVDLINEKKRVADAIVKTKASLPLDIDSTIALNKTRSEYIQYLEYVLVFKSSERKGTGVGYKFDVEGKQTSYNYDTKTIQTINFDRNIIRKLQKKLKKECEDLSMQIDQLMVTAEVDFSPAYDMLDKLDDILCK